MPIPANIAEACGIDSEAETIRFFIIAMGSAAELEYLLLLAKDLEYITVPVFEELNNELIEIRKMLNGFIKKLKLRQNS